MLVTLIRKNNINKIILPQIVFGNYWINDKINVDKKLINIEGKDGFWQITSNNNIKIIDANTVKINENDDIVIDPKESKILEKAILKEYERYVVFINEIKEPFLLYCLPMYDKNFYHLAIKNTAEITIGRDSDNDIQYKDQFVSRIHAKMIFNNGRWELNNLDDNFGTFVNNIPVLEQGIQLANGDVVFIMGFRIIIMGKSIFINIPQNKIVCNNNVFSLIKNNLETSDDDAEEKDIEMYSDGEYFSRAPKITELAEREIVKFEAPPSKQKNDETPLILVLGSSLSMGAMMIISIITAIDGKISGTSSTKQMIFSLVTAISMLIAMILFPILNAKYEKKKKKENEIKRQVKYKEYLNKKGEELDFIREKHKKILLENYVSPEECARMIISRDTRLWERKIKSSDFLNIRFGIGDVPLDVEIQYPEEKFSIEDDNLLKLLRNVVDQFKYIELAPVVVNIAEKNIAGIVANKDQDINRYLQTIIIQLIAFHSYEDLKLVFLLDENSKEWEYVKMLPHVWNNTKQFRFFADNESGMKEISLYLEEELNSRLEYEENNDINYKSFEPYYCIITNNYKKIENLNIIKDILKLEKNLGFSLLCITNNLTKLPNECKVFVTLEDDKNGMVFEDKVLSTSKRRVTFNNSVTFMFENISKVISNIPLRLKESGSNSLPNSYNFLEMYNVGRIEQLNVLNRWKKNDSTLSLSTPIGIDGSGDIVYLDIHEKFHGAHGLIAGSTGSGKSEFIITYILSLAVNYHPDDLTFILIDYKGGGLAGAFKKGHIKLPHLVGTITNIDTNELQRSLDSIQSELRRRQVMFNEARDMTDEGTIDIYKYQKLYHQGVVSKPISHLLIICDEFAELKQQQPEFMEELMSVSRIGRSLGVHLILATQKPAGVVNDQIRSNSRFAVCLKVQSRDDSNDVISRPDAANLKKAGQFYFKVGNDEYFTLGQAAWAGATYYPAETIPKKIDTSIQFVSDTGAIIAQVDDFTKKTLNSQGEQLTNIVKYLFETAEENNIVEESLWLESIPETIFVKDIRDKYKVKQKKNVINAVIGEYDDPFNQRQDVVNLDLSNQGNIAIYGNAESGKETLLSTLVYDLITEYNSSEVQLYLLDFGSEALKIYKDAPHVGDIALSEDMEKIDRLFDVIQEEINERKKILSNYNGDYNNYVKETGEVMPQIVIVINGFEVFSEVSQEKYDDLFMTITREGVKYRIVFVVTASSYSDLRYRLSHNFQQKIALKLNSDDDYFNILDGIGKKRPANIFGRGLINIEKNIYEFQTAKICSPEEYNEKIIDAIKKLNDEGQEKARSIPVLPERVLLEDLKEYIKDLTSVPIGISADNLKVYNYNFQKDFVNIITGKGIKDVAKFSIYVLKEILQIEGVFVNILDAEKIVSSINIDFNAAYNSIAQSAIKGEKKNVICVIIGVEKFINNANINFNEKFGEIKDSNNCNFIIIEDANVLKKYEYEPWYKNYVSKDSGIWVGNGVQGQYLININSDKKQKISDNCGKSLGYAIKQGKASMIKLVGMKEDDGDE